MHKYSTINRSKQEFIWLSFQALGSCKAEKSVCASRFDTCRYGMNCGSSDWATEERTDYRPKTHTRQTKENIPSLNWQKVSSAVLMACRFFYYDHCWEQHRENVLIQCNFIWRESDSGEFSIKCLFLLVSISLTKHLASENLLGFHFPRYAVSHVVHRNIWSWKPNKHKVNIVMMTYIYMWF